MSQRKSVSIIIPNYNGHSLLEKYLPYTLRAIELADVPFELIIVDDCSSDGSVDLVRARYPEVKILVNPVNRGFSYTCNRGIREAEMELVLLLNSDVSLSEDYFARLWRYFDAPDTFGVMSRIVNSGEKIEDAARFLSFSGMKFKGTHFFYSNDPSKKTPTAYLSGANALVSREKLMELSGFDEVFSPFYCEDVDLSFRAWRLGWKCYYEHDAVCHHEVSTTIRSANSKKKLLSVVYRNKFILHAIHLDGWQLGLWYAQMILVEVLLRVFVGKFWILSALKGFWNRRDQVRTSRERLAAQMAAKRSTLRLSDVKRMYFDPIGSWDVTIVR
jgi:GT2 family glycosyltransferase